MQALSADGWTLTEEQVGEHLAGFRKKRQEFGTQVGSLWQKLGKLNEEAKKLKELMITTGFTTTPRLDVFSSGLRDTNYGAHGWFE